MRHFFCENCGEEVREKDEVCRHCGALFVAIKCPRCGYRGKQHEFAHGCPRCGYLGDQVHTRALTESEVRSDSAVTRRKPMPAWVFWMVLFFLGASFIVLARLYARL